MKNSFLAKNLLILFTIILGIGMFYKADARCIEYYVEYSIPSSSPNPGNLGFLKITDLGACCGESVNCSIQANGDSTCSGKACREVNW